MRLFSVIPIIIALLFSGQSTKLDQGAEVGRVLQVGSGKAFSAPSKAAAVARDGDFIEIDVGVYRGDVAVWRANNLTLRGVGGRPHLEAAGANAQGKAIWVIQGNHATIENIEFSGAKVPDGNGAAIRQEALGLIVRNCLIHDNEVGILTWNNPENEVLIETSEFFGSSGDYNHNIYVGAIAKFTLQFSYVHHAVHGHNVKSRAQRNYILYNRIMDETSGRSSYAIDLPNGGQSYVIGNLIQKGRNAENPNVVSYAEEGPANSLQELYLVNNTIVSDFGRGYFLRLAGAPTVSVINNIFAGRGVSLPSLASAHHNLVSKNPLFRDEAAFDYRLTRNSPAINAGIDPGVGAGFDLSPHFHYVHPAGYEVRNNKAAPDIGAYEFVGEN